MKTYLSMITSAIVMALFIAAPAAATMAVSFMAVGGVFAIAGCDYSRRMNPRLRPARKRPERLPLAV